MIKDSLLEDDKDKFNVYKRLFFSYDLHLTKDIDIKLKFINSIITKENKEFNIDLVNKNHLYFIRHYTLYPLIFLWSNLSGIKGDPSELIQYYLYQLGYSYYQVFIEAFLYEDMYKLKDDIFLSYLLYNPEINDWVFEGNQQLIQYYLDNRTISNFLLESRFIFISTLKL